MMAYGKYLRIDSAENPIHVEKRPFYMDLIHVYLYGKYMHWCQYWIRFALELMNWNLDTVYWVFDWCWCTVLCAVNYFVYCDVLVVVGNVHKWLDQLFTPSRMTWFLWYIMNLLSMNTTWHPYAHNWWVEIIECYCRLDTMYDSMSSSGRWGRYKLHVCVDLTTLPSGKVLRDWVVRGMKLL